MEKLIQVFKNGECVPVVERYKAYRKLAEYEKTELSPAKVEELKAKYFETVCRVNELEKMIVVLLMELEEVV